MRVKKNPKADVGRRSLLFFQIGMIVMLLLAWQAIEWKTYDKKDSEYAQLMVDDDLMEEVPITDISAPPPPPPPPPPPAPEEIEVFEDDDDVEETIIESTEASQEKAIEPVEIREIQEEVIEEVIEEVPFAVIENVPVYPGCENEKTNDARKNCMSSRVAAFVNKNFNTNLANDLGLDGRQRISVMFKIDQNGNVVEVRARAPHPRLEREAVNVVSKLPKMTPGQQRGKPVSVLYSLPIVFEIQ